MTRRDQPDLAAVLIEVVQQPGMIRGDPGPGLVFSPLGGVMLLTGVGLTARGLHRDGRDAPG